MGYSMLALAACGAAGALTYSLPIYLKALSEIPPAKFPLANCLFSLFVGLTCSILFTQMIGYHWPWTVEPEPWPLAMVIGLASNPLVPIVLRRLEDWARIFGGKVR